MTSVHITTLGCPKNNVDSTHLQRFFISEGFSTVHDPEDATLLFINTCGFIREAKEESIQEILKLAEIKKGKGLRKKEKEKAMGSGKKLLVFGCLAQRYRDELLREIPEIDAVWGVGEEEKILEYCKQVRRQETGDNRQKTIDKRQEASSYAYLKIAEGCDKGCTFCVIPAIRGRFRSVQPDVILREAEDYIKSGVKELILVAQDIISYGREFKGYSLVALLRDLACIDGDFLIRLLYLYPTMIDDSLLECIASEEKICNYLDIPLQHSEDRILRLMGRRGTKQQYLKLLRTIRREIPGIALRTTFIAGFPTETEEESHSLIDFIEEARFDRLGVFRYSREQGTPAARLKGHLPEQVKQKRLDEIMRRQSLISLEKNRELIGRRFRAIVDEVDADIAIARLYSHAPEIDGLVIIEKTKDQRPEIKVNVGDMVFVEIEDAYDYDLKARLVLESVSR